ncbi:hypothetical protein FSP39_008101 [Pinctada imbricata]|nr:hypothetical protein FSP39_008101 [Pinctada imbricata]
MLQLPERTADEGVYIIAGEIPIEAEIDRKILTQLMQIFRGEDIEKDIAERQLAVKDSTSNSWFIYAGKILEKYDLPKIHDLLRTPIAKGVWKKQLTESIINFWKHDILEKAKEKSSLKNLDLKDFKVGNIHSIWKHCNEDTLAVSKAGIKAKLLTGTYLLQSNVAKFQQKSETATCKLCGRQDETVEHFILICEAIEPQRKPFMEKFRKILEQHDVWNHIQVNKDLQLLSIINPGHWKVPLRLQDDGTLHDLESIGRGMCHALHRARSNYLENIT